MDRPKRAIIILAVCYVFCGKDDNGPVLLMGTGPFGKGKADIAGKIPAAGACIFCGLWYNINKRWHCQ